MNSRGIILAAGRGSRMGEHTESKPKCLNYLSGKTLLDWQLKSLSDCGITKINVVTGYLADMVHGNFITVENKRWANTNMVSSLFCLKNDITNSIVSYSDIVYKASHIKKLNDFEGDIVISADLLWKNLWKLRFDNPLDDAETFKSSNGILTEIGNKTDDICDIEAQYMGLLKFTPKGWDIMYKIYKTFNKSKQDKMDMTSMLNELLNFKIKINVVFVNGGWCEADNWSDIIAYEKELKSNLNWTHNWK